MSSKAKPEYEEGIYFGMPEDEYHSLPYFSRSVAENIIVDVEECWWNSPFNPDKPEVATKAMDLGKAIHSMLLEPDIFKDLYCTVPNAEDYNDKTILATCDQLKDFLSDVGEKKSGSKPEMIKRALPHIDANTYVIWDQIIGDFNKQVEDGQKRVLSQDDDSILRGIKESLQRRPQVQQILNNIRSEITVIWRDKETGVLCKCRVDCARPEAIGEVKSFSLKRRKNLFKAICDEIVYSRYNMQYYIYHMALAHTIDLVNRGKAKVFGDVDPEWLRLFLAMPNKRYFFIFTRTQAPYQIKAVEATKAFVKGATKNVYYEDAQMNFRIAINTYKKCLDTFGTNRWIDSKEIEHLADEHVPNIIYQGYNH